MSLFSVIIPTYNRAKDLDRCLASLVAQTYKDFEVIVCDDGSTDNSKDVAESYQNKLNIRYIWEDNWGGPARPRNNGIKLAASDWICFLDSDDWWYPNKLEECSRYFDSYDVIYHDLDMYNNPLGEPFKRLSSRQLSSNPFSDLMLNHNALFNSSVVVRKNILNLVGGITEDKKLISIEDLDCWLKISKITNKFFYLPQSLGAYLIENNISRKIKHVESLEVLCLKYIEDLHSRKEKKRVIKGLRYDQARIYHVNGYFGQALSLYLQAGVCILFKKIFKYFLKRIQTRNKI